MAGEEGTTCLSMHQPWASLLVYGIKRIEGRSWHSNFRGRLWIHATVREVDAAELAELHEFYTQVHELDGRVPTFPESYPTGVLLGSVQVVDVRVSEDMASLPLLPDSLRLELQSPFVFLCQSPRRCVVPLQVRGQPKLWELTRKLADAARRGLRAPPHLLPFEWAPYLQAPARPAAGSGRGCVAGHKGTEVLDTAAIAGTAHQPPAADAQALPLDAEGVQRRVRALRKKLREVEQLKAAQLDRTLEPVQVEKIQRGPQLQQELDHFLAL